MTIRVSDESELTRVLIGPIGIIIFRISIVVSFPCACIGLAIARFTDLMKCLYLPNSLCHPGSYTHIITVFIGSMNQYWIQRGSCELWQNSVGQKFRVIVSMGFRSHILGLCVFLGLGVTRVTHGYGDD